MSHFSKSDGIAYPDLRDCAGQHRFRGYEPSSASRAGLSLLSGVWPRWFEVGSVDRVSLDLFTLVAHLGAIVLP